ncbi:MAG: hypothetical protein KJ795_01380 [Gammaproteobacteria bacterium]|nr:hypothetical protein [Gammaproteobacteria bacterium]MBU1777822.1 hypothetical protein [Gammaproteobacteria bacterium]
MFNTPPHLGFLHVPKCAGSSLNESIFLALELQPFHVSMLAPRNSTVEQKSPWNTIVEGTLAFKLARNMPYVPGHITYSDLIRLNRKFIFTVLRDPRKRVISLFTYAEKRANSPQVVHKYPKLKQYANMGFSDFMNHRKPVNEAAMLLLGDIEGFVAIAEKQDRSNPGKEFIEIVENGLRRLDAIYACSNQKVLDDLHARGFIPQTKEVWKNKSDNNVNFGKLGSQQEFLELLDHAAWQDVMVYRIAQQLFPETMRVPLASDEEILSEVENRFGASFTDR